MVSIIFAVEVIWLYLILFAIARGVEHEGGNTEAADAARNKLRRWNPVLLVKFNMTNAQLR